MHQKLHDPDKTQDSEKGKHKKHNRMKPTFWEKGKLPIESNSCQHYWSDTNTSVEVWKNQVNCAKKLIKLVWKFYKFKDRSALMNHIKQGIKIYF